MAYDSDGQVWCVIPFTVDNAGEKLCLGGYGHFILATKDKGIVNFSEKVEIPAIGQIVDTDNAVEKKERMTFSVIPFSADEKVLCDY